jgi:hypothetical protein
LLTHYGPDTAIFLSNLIDKYKYFKDKDLLEEEDWFFITHERQIEQIGLSVTKLRACKSTLKDANILETKLKGAPPKEWYKLNLNILLNKVIPIVNQPSGYVTVKRQDSLGLTVTYPDGSIKDNKDKENRKEKNKQKSESFLPLASYLSEIIRSNKNIKHTPSQLSSWSNDMRVLSESFIDTQNTYRRIEKALRYYSKHIGEKYMVEIESGKSLKEKFTKLEAAMSRDNSPFDNRPKMRMEAGEKWYLNSKDGYYYNDESKRLMD